MGSVESYSCVLLRIPPWFLTWQDTTGMKWHRNWELFIHSFQASTEMLNLLTPHYTTVWLIPEFGPKSVWITHPRGLIEETEIKTVLVSTEVLFSRERYEHSIRQTYGCTLPYQKAMLKIASRVGTQGWLENPLEALLEGWKERY